MIHWNQPKNEHNRDVSTLLMWQGLCQEPSCLLATQQEEVTVLEELLQGVTIWSYRLGTTWSKPSLEPSEAKGKQ